MTTIEELRSLGFKKRPRFGDWVREEHIADWGTGKFRPVIMVTPGEESVSVGSDDCNMCEATGIKTFEDLKEFLKLCGY